MPTVDRRRCWGSSVSLLAMAMVTACATGAGTTAQLTSSTSTTTASTTTTTVAPAPAAQKKNWFDLDLGDCLADPPPEDPSVIEVTIVDCATTHQAEVYLREPLAVNTALTDVADRACAAGFADYTGQQVDSGPYTVSYLIDSTQNRTSSNPNPSAVICLLQASSGQPLTASARR